MSATATVTATRIPSSGATESSAKVVKTFCTSTPDGINGEKRQAGPLRSARRNILVSLAVLVVLIARLVRRHPKEDARPCHDVKCEKSENQSHRNHSKRPLRGLKWWPAIAALACSITAGILAFQWYNSSLAIPDVPNIAGGIAPFVSQPNATVQLEAKFHSLQDPDGAGVSLSLVIDGHRPGRLIKYVVVFSDDAQLHTFGGRGRSPGPLLDSLGNEKLEVHRIRMAVESGIESDNPAQVLIGEGITNNYGYIIRNYEGFLRKPVAAMSGSHRVIVLPTVGFITIPSKIDTPQLQLTLFRLGIPGKWYTPTARGSITTVDVAPESPLSRIDYVSPPLADPGELAWAAGGIIRARVSDVAVGMETNGQRLLFLAGALAGISSSFFIWFLELSLAAVRRGQDDGG